MLLKFMTPTRVRPMGQLQLMCIRMTAHAMSSFLRNFSFCKQQLYNALSWSGGLRFTRLKLQLPSGILGLCAESPATSRWAVSVATSTTITHVTNTTGAIMVLPW